MPFSRTGIISSGGGGGDVIGPAVSVDNDIALFNGITGKVIKDSTSKLADFALVANGVTNGDSHDHVGGDGAQIDHGGLAGLADDDHAQYLNLDKINQTLQQNLSVSAGVTIDGKDVGGIGIDNNVLRGVLGVSSIFTTAPTNLANMTDGDHSTVTGTGTKVMGGAGNFGAITFDLGSITMVIIGARVGIWSSAASAFMFFESSDDNVTWTSTGIEDSGIQAANIAEQISDSLVAILRGRYVRLRFYVTGAATANAKIYEVYGWKLTI